MDKRWRVRDKVGGVERGKDKNSETERERERGIKEKEK